VKKSLCQYHMHSYRKYFKEIYEQDVKISHLVLTNLSSRSIIVNDEKAFCYKDRQKKKRRT